jgi:hypothetical protein
MLIRCHVGKKKGIYKLKIDVVKHQVSLKPHPHPHPSPRSHLTDSAFPVVGNAFELTKVILQILQSRGVAGDTWRPKKRWISPSTWANQAIEPTKISEDLRMMRI